MLSIRYLTKITEQVICLLSDDHSRSLVWDDAPDESPSDDWNMVSDRLFTFEVLKTQDQEEGIAARPGFKVRLPLPRGHSTLDGPLCSWMCLLFRPKDLPLRIR